MRWDKVLTIVVILAVIVAGGYYLAKPIEKNINLGLDLQGGLHVVLQAIETPRRPVTDDAMNGALGILQERINALGLKEPIVQREGNDRIIVELAGVKDAQEAIDLLGSMAILEFKTEDKKVVIDGSMLKNAQAQINSQTNQPEVSLDFNTEGARIFAEVTGANIGKKIGIYLDDKLLTDPVVQSRISGGKAVITGSQSLEEAQRVALLLRSGALPVELDFAEKRIVGPTLGADSLAKSKAAGAYGILAIFAFMILYYRVPGFVADFSIIVYSLLVLGILAALNATLTVPGIAGFLLSIGMAVDANVIIYERLKEELRSGKTLRAAIDAGFDRAFTTIVDANVTTLIAAAVLYYFGTSSIRGFAITLSIGILASMFTAITLTRYLLRLSAETNIKNTWLYGK